MMKHSLTLILIISSHFVIGQEPGYIWGQTISGSDVSGIIPTCLYTDEEGDLYAAGFFQWSVDFDPGPGVNSRYAGERVSAYMRKSDPDGNLLWVETVQGSGESKPVAIRVDSEGNIYTAGHCLYTIDADPGPGSMTFHATTRDMYIRKFSPDGDHLGTFHFESTGHQELTDFYIDSDDNFYLVGTFFSPSDFDPGVGVAARDDNGNDDVFIVKLDSDYNFQWVHTMGGTLNDVVTSVVVDDLGGVYITGQFYNSIDIDPGVGETIITSIGTHDAFVIKYTSGGELEWGFPLGGYSAGEFGRGLTIDNNGDLLIAGDFGQTVDFDPGPDVYVLDANDQGGSFVLKLSTAGTFIWARNFGGHSNLKGIDFDTDDYIYTIGEFRGTSDFDPGADSLFMYGAGYEDVFMHKMDSEGNFNWARKIGGSGFDFPGDLAVDPDANIFYTGNFVNTVDLNPNAGVHEVTGSFGGSRTGFYVKFNQCFPNEGFDSAVSCHEYFWEASGTLYDTSGTYFTTLVNESGCDSLVTLNLTINPMDSSQQDVGSCFSYYWELNEMDYLESGIYSDTLLNIMGCDSIVMLNLTIHDLPEVEFLALAEEVLCVSAAPVLLEATPLGGVFSGTGVSGANFEPSSAGEGVHYIYYSYTNDFGCAAMDSVLITVVDCLGIDEISNAAISVYPNPFTDFTVIHFNGELKTPHEIQVHDLLGQLVYSKENVSDQSLVISKADVGTGVFTLSLLDPHSGKVSTVKLIVE